MKKILLSIFFTFTITLFIYSQEVTVSGGHSVQENKTTKVILNAVNGSVRIHKHVLEGTVFGYGSGSAWNSDTGYTSISTNTTVNTSTSEYLCNTPAELIIDKPIKLSIGGDNWYSFTINPTGGTQYWDVKGFDKKKFWWGVGVMILSVAPFGYAAYSFEANDNLIAGIISGIGGVGLFTTGSVMMFKSDYKITLVKIEY